MLGGLGRVSHNKVISGAASLYVEVALRQGERPDLDALEGAVRSGATLIGEFNTAAEPTVDSVRLRAERLFGFRWTGWTGR